MKKHIVTTTVVLVLVVIAILAYAALLIWIFSQEGIPGFWTIVIMIIPLIAILWLISVYRERVKELKEQDEDPLDQY